nr:ROK family protein [Bifidobacterium choloepi]
MTFDTKGQKASPSDVRRKNRSVIFSLLFPNTDRSRAELGRLTGLSRVAVSDVVSGMLDAGLIRESGFESSSTGKGKRATLLGVDTTRLRIISLDLSQAQLIQCAVTDLLGRPLERMEVALGPDNTVEVDAIIQLVDQLRADVDRGNIIGIGIAVPGVVEDGVIRQSTQLGWRDVDLRGLLETRFGVPVTIVNDTVASMLAERFFGSAGPNLLFIKNDRGIGAATLIDDKIVVGDNHAAGEIGHVAIDPVDGPDCPCGKRGCLEMLVSAVAIRERLRTASSEDERIALIEDAGRRFAAALAMPIGLLDIADVCVYGPPDVINNTFLDAGNEEFKRTSASMFHPDTSMRRCQLGADIALRGAAIAVVRDYIAQ